MGIYLKGRAVKDSGWGSLLSASPREHMASVCPLTSTSNRGAVKCEDRAPTHGEEQEKDEQSEPLEMPESGAARGKSRRPGEAVDPIREVIGDAKRAQEIDDECRPM